ncbi:MAG: glycosyltransferase family 2 protein [Erysipelotrichales bacterium]|nr:glycosyltransferase family 2 protein [Erysipelotrichales bacterium]
MKKFKIIVPCYNEAKSLKLFYEELKEHITYSGYESEIIFVNDGSKDNTLNIIKELAQEDSRIRYISFSRNFGKEAAMYAGLKAAENSNCAVIIDGDLQHDPKIIKLMMEEYEKGFKLIYTRKQKRTESIFKKFILAIFYFIFRRVTKMKMEKGINDFQFLDQTVIKAYLEMTDNVRFLKGISTYVGFTRKCLDISINKRIAGKGSWNYFKLFRYAFNGINQFSQFLLFFPKLAIFLTVIGFFVNGFLFFQEIITRGEFIILLQINIFAFLLFIILYFLFYLIYSLRKETIKRPLFLIEESSVNVEN